jgi:endonuclease/exonuclease/phosphatase family metal-dependent hydrolase
MCQLIKEKLNLFKDVCSHLLLNKIIFMSTLYKKKISVMSYNIWFSEYEREKRLKSLIYTINKENPDVVCLQEVLTNEYAQLKSSLKYENYFPSVIDEGTYGCVIFSKFKINKSKQIKLPSNMNRNLLICDVNLTFDCNGTEENTKIIIANTHFESEFAQSDNTIKIGQYTYVSAILNKLFLDHGNIILCADTNVIKSEYENFDRIFSKMNDAWRDTGSDSKKEYTYDNITNKNLKHRKIDLRSRIDRILYRSKDSMNIEEFKLITGEKDLIQPSDHHGTMAIFNVMRACFKV